MTYKTIFQLAPLYREPDPLEQVSINWPRKTWLTKRRAELAANNLAGNCLTLDKTNKEEQDNEQE